MKKIWNWIVNIPKDKLLHFDAAAFIDLYSFAVLYRFCPVWLAVTLADMLGVIALALKELYDAHHEDHSVELDDFLWGMIGIFVVNVALLIMFL